ncbi:MAG TPA: ABC transporter substrate-binding protein [Streptosporangiaceae bacterium]|nr:ABC transporter substrate-binding protein [Streptosporangiaceae bacterium]
MTGPTVMPGPGPTHQLPRPLHAYIGAFARCGAAATSFFWSLDDGGWYRVRLTAAPGGDTRVEAELAALPFRLTARELDVLTLLTAGFSNTEIGACLVASPRTVSTHVEHILAKLDQPSRTGAAAMAVERGLLRLPLPGRASGPDGLTICRMHRLASQADWPDPAPPSGHRPPRPSPPAAHAGTGAARSRAGPGPAHGPARRRPLRIGSAFPLSGPASDDGRQMRNGSALAVAEINARGGIGGRLIEQVVVDVDIFSAAGATRAFEMLFAAEVDALTSGYVFTEDVAAGLAARYGAPFLHAMTSQSQAETVRDNYPAFRNLFQVCPTEVNYGPGFIRFLSQARASGWQPRSRRLAVIQTVLPSGQMLNQHTVEAAARSGWEIVAARTVPATGADWAAVTSDLERLDPAAVMIAQFLTGELATFQVHAAARLPGTLVYAIYAPSVPEFLQLAGPAAEGLVWATVTGTYDDSIGHRFRDGYQAAFGRPPGWSHAGIAYDEVYLLALAWRAVADPRDFAAVSRELRQLRHRGVNGAYFLDNAEQSGLSFPDTTPDPSLGQAHLMLQVQDGTHRIISPDPYAEARFIPPTELPERAQRRRHPAKAACGTPRAAI